MSSKKVQMKQVRLVGGPLNGRLVTVPKSSELYDLKFWQYDYAGKVGGEEYFVKRPRARVTKRFIAHYISVNGKHPAVVRYLHGAA